ncbi:hypothetical protein ACF0H5_009577 [Mactra antiquata]
MHGQAPIYIVAYLELIRFYAVDNSDNNNNNDNDDNDDDDDDNGDNNNNDNDDDDNGNEKRVLDIFLSLTRIFSFNYAYFYGAMCRIAM